MFISMLIVIGVMGLSGFAWTLLPVSRFSFWLTLLAFLLAVSAGMVASYSFISFSQFREIRSLMLLLLGLNLALWSFLFLVTHPSSASWSTIFADRAKNRTLGIAFVLIAVPCILIGSFGGDAKPRKSSIQILLLWGTVLMPIVSLWFFFSPTPVFLMTDSTGGIEGLTPIGMIASFGYLVAQILAVVRLGQKWRKTRESIDLSLLFAMSEWVVGTIFIIILWDPLQIAELIWIGSIIFGLFFIGAVQFISSIVHPHKILESLVEQRTVELELSKKESEFYLSMWTHKMGNILQGIVTYLDLIELEDIVDENETVSAARALSQEATLVNNQVLRLTQIMDTFPIQLMSIDIDKALKKAIKSSKDILDDESFIIEYSRGGDLSVMADRLLDLTFQSAILFFAKRRFDDKSPVRISLSEINSSLPCT